MKTRKGAYLETVDFFAERKARANMQAWKRIMTREGAEPPQPGDELPDRDTREGA